MVEDTPVQQAIDVHEGAPVQQAATVQAGEPKVLKHLQFCRQGLKGSFTMQGPLLAQTNLTHSKLQLSDMKACECCFACYFSIASCSVTALRVIVLCA